MKHRCEHRTAVVLGMDCILYMHNYCVYVENILFCVTKESNLKPG